MKAFLLRRIRIVPLLNGHLEWIPSAPVERFPFEITISAPLRFLDFCTEIPFLPILRIHLFD